MKELLLAVLVIAAVLAVFVASRPGITSSAGGRLLAFLAVFLLPALALGFGGLAHLETSKTTEFCLSCHVMEPYGESLQLDDESYLPAGHYQNRLVDRKKACYSCHTDYTMYGDVKAKLQGAKHLWVNYVGTPPEKIELYSPYRNRECLGCHGGSRSYLENEMHEGMYEELQAEETSCLDCHEWIHGTEELADLERWHGGEAK